MTVPLLYHRLHAKRADRFVFRLPSLVSSCSSLAILKERKQIEYFRFSRRNVRLNGTALLLTKGTVEPMQSFFLLSVVSKTKLYKLNKQRSVPELTLNT